MSKHITLQNTKRRRGGIRHVGGLWLAIETVPLAGNSVQIHRHMLGETGVLLCVSVVVLLVWKGTVWLNNNNNKKKRDQGYLKTRCPCQIIFSSIIIPPHDLWFHIKIDLNLSPVVICYQSCYQSENRGFNALCFRNRYWTTNSLLCDSAWQRCMNVSVLSIHRKRSVSCIHKTNPSEKINK